MLSCPPPVTVFHLYLSSVNYICLFLTLFLMRVLFFLFISSKAVFIPLPTLILFIVSFFFHEMEYFNFQLYWLPFFLKHVKKKNNSEICPIFNCLLFPFLENQDCWKITRYLIQQQVTQCPESCKQWGGSWMHKVTINKLAGKLFTNLMQCLQMLEYLIRPDVTDFFCSCSVCLGML